MNEWHTDSRRYSLYRVRRCDPNSGEITGTRYYVQKPAALARAARWREAGYRVHLDRGGPVRFQGAR